MTVRVHLGGGEFAELEPERFEVDRALLEPLELEETEEQEQRRLEREAGQRLGVIVAGGPNPTDSARVEVQWIEAGGPHLDEAGSSRS